ncbi:MAG: hypothetical protein ACK4RG_09660 [Fimbriimonadales bacterium]
MRTRRWMTGLLWATMGLLCGFAQSPLDKPQLVSTEWLALGR